MAFYLGGRVEGFHIEVHDVQFHVGKSSEEILPRIQKKWKGKKNSLHVDSWLILDKIDGYKVHLLNNSSPLQEERQKLFLVNIGFYQKNFFGELHNFHFLAAKNKSEAKSKALKLFSGLGLETHSDDLFDIDDCLELNLVENYQIQLLESPQEVLSSITNGWQRIRP